MFKPLKHNNAVALLARYWFRARTSRLEKVIFTATTGRSGTKTLTKLFSLVPDCTAHHEPYPVMNGPVLRAASYGDTALVDRAYRQIKSVDILRAAVGYRYYFEANHQFIKSFSQQAIDEFGDRLTVIHLVRSPIEVATSIFRLAEFPGTDVGNTWWLDYRAPTNLIQIADVLDFDAAFSNPFYKALWYWHEIEMRIAALRTKVPSLKVTRFETDWFSDKGKVIEFLDDLGIDYDKSGIESIVIEKEHRREHHKRIAGLPSEQAQDMLFRFQELLARRRT